MCEGTPLTDTQRSHLEELLRDRPQWFREKVMADIAAEEPQEDRDARGIGPGTGLSSHTLACLEAELGIM